MFVSKFKFQAGRFHCNFLTSAIAIPLGCKSCKIKNVETSCSMYYAHMLKLKMHKKFVQCTYYAAEARLKLSGSLTLW